MQSLIITGANFLSTIAYPRRPKCFTLLKPFAGIVAHPAPLHNAPSG